VRRNASLGNVREISIGVAVRITMGISNGTHNANDRNDTNDLEGSSRGEKCNSYRCCKVFQVLSGLIECNKV
jgi:hypothetical protein